MMSMHQLPVHDGITYAHRLRHFLPDVLTANLEAGCFQCVLELALPG